MLSALYYARLYLSHGVRLLWRNRFWSAVTLMVITLLLFVVYTMVVTTAHADNAARRMDEQMVVTAVIAQTKTDYRSIVPAAKLAKEASKIPGVRKVRIVTEDEARRRFVANMHDLKAVPSPWVFAEMLEVSVTDVSKMGPVRDALAKLNGISQATYLEKVVERVTTTAGHISQMVVGGAVLLGIIALLVVMAVVKTALYSERKSVATMSSVGGSVWSISAPLIVQMGIVSIAASLLACLAGWWIDPKIGSSAGEPVKNLPAWLVTGRAFGLFELWPYFALGAVLATSSIVIWGTWRYSRRPAALLLSD